MGALISPNNCANCAHVNKEGVDLFCWYDPPKAHAVAMPGPDGNLRMMNLTLYPKVEPHWRCSHYKRGLATPEGFSA